MNKATKRIVAFIMAVMLVISGISFGNTKAEAAEAYTWGPIDFSTAKSEGGAFVLGNGGEQYGMQLLDTSTSAMSFEADGLHITSSNGGWKAINILTGSAVGGHDYWANDGFKPTAGKEYKVTFDATVDSGTGQVNIIGNKTDQKTTNLSAGTINKIEYTYTQAADGGNLIINTGGTPVGVALIINNLMIKEVLSAAPTPDTEIYNMQNDLASKNDGDIITGTGLLARSGGPTITVRNSTEGKKLVITNRDVNYAAVDIKLSALNLNPDCKYNFVITGKTSEVNTGVFLAQSNDPWGWKKDVLSDSAGNFTLNKVFTYEELQADKTAGQNYRIKDDNTSDYEIYSIVITEIGNEVEPSGENHCYKIVTGSNQWEGAEINASELNLQFGNEYEFSLDVYTPDKEVGILVQHSVHWAHIVKDDFYTPDVKEWKTISGIFDLTGDIFDFSKIQIVKNGDKLNYNKVVTFYIDNFTVTDIDSGEVVYFEGFEKGNHKFTGGSVVKESVVYEEPDPITGMYALDVPSLKEIYKDDFLIGNIVNPGDFNNEERYEILKHHYNVLTFENSMKPDAMWGPSSSYTKPESPNFSVDQNIKTMLNDGFLLHGHALAWHGQSPNWIHLASGKREATTGADTPVYKPYAEVKANLNTFVNTIAGHYYDNPDGLEVYSWDVLNEAIRKNPSYAISEETWGYHTIGHIFASPQWNSPWYLCYQKDAPPGVNPWDYVYDLFYEARKADPNAILYYNDYGMEDPNQVKMVVNMVNAVNKRYASEHPEAGGRLLIEGIGMQEHDTINTNLDNVDKAIKAYIDTGCVVSISELDVGVPGYKKGDKLSQEDEIKQALYYAKIFNIFKKYSYGIERVTFWGLDDMNSWRADEICLVFDGNLRTKLAYDAIADPEGFIIEYDTPFVPPVIPENSLESIAVYGTPDMGSFNDSLWNTTAALPIVRRLEADYGATGIAKVLWDEENLYVQVTVNDTCLNKSNTNVWEQDAVEIFFNEVNNRSKSYIDGMGQYRINYENQISFGSQASNEGVQSYTTTIEDGYMVELKIPFQFHNPSIGDYIGFDAQINDADENGIRYNVVMWSDTSGKSYAEGDKWGALKLVKASPITPPSTDNGSSGGNNTDTNSNKIAVSVNGNESYTAQVKDNTVIVTVPTNSVNDFIDKLTEELKTNPDKEQVIELKLGGTPDTVNKVSFSLQTQVVADIVEKTDASIKIDVDNLGTLIISNEALETILNTDKGNDIRFVVESVNETKDTKLNKAQLEAVGDNPVFDFNIYIGSRKVSDFGTGSITVILPYTPADDMNLGSIIVYYVDSKGNIQEVNNSYYDKESGTVCFTVSHFSVYMISYNYITFIDIIGNSAKAKIEYAAARGLLNGVIEGNMYLPNQKLTRSEFVQMLQNILKVSRSKEVQFKDVGMDTKYYNAIMCFKGAGLLDGISVVNNQFKPDAAITREEMTAILGNILRYKGVEPESYVELSMKYGDLDKISTKYVNDVQLVVSCGLMNYTSKMPDGKWKFSAKSAGTRQQAARILVSLLELLNKNNIYR